MHRNYIAHGSRLQKRVVYFCILTFPVFPKQILSLLYCWDVIRWPQNISSVTTLFERQVSLLIDLRNSITIKMTVFFCPRHKEGEVWGEHTKKLNSGTLNSWTGCSVFSSAYSSLNLLNYIGPRKGNVTVNDRPYLYTHTQKSVFFLSADARPKRSQQGGSLQGQPCGPSSAGPLA